MKRDLGAPPPPKKAAKKTPKKRKPGRPSLYTPKLAAEILRRTAEGDTLTAICREAHMPNRSNVWEWQERHPEFRDNLTRAREEQAFSWMDAAIEIADGAPDKARGLPGTGEAGARVMAEKLRVDTRMKLIGRLNRRLAENHKQEITGADGGAIAIETKARDAGEEERFAKLLAAADVLARPPTP
jgi:hypothetical protein